MRKILLALIINILLLPVLVLGEELPREGVTYFLEYPNGYEEVTESYEEAIDPEEKLIAEYTTNINGEIGLNDWENEEKIRIAQEVPNGYSTQMREAKVNLANSDSVVFTNYKGLVNPNTGRSLLFTLLLIILVSITYIVFRNKKIKQIETVLILVILFTGSFFVKANESDFVIRVIDGTGKGIENVRVKIYATPKVEASPAIKFDANGGEFLDGTTVMYFRIPYNNYPLDNFYESLSDKDKLYFRMNYGKATREGFYLNRNVDTSNSVSNGDVINLDWEENSEAHVVTVDGNGATLDIGKKKLPIIKTYSPYEFFGKHPVEESVFLKDGDTFVELDNNPSCTNFPYGIKTNDEIIYDDIYYACWVNKIDGLYFYNSSTDEEPYRIVEGNKDLCFKDITPTGRENISFGIPEGNVQIFYVNDIEKIKFSAPMIFEIGSNNSVIPSARSLGKIEIVYHGETKLSSISDNWLGGSEMLYGRFVYRRNQITNEEENLIFYNYLNDYLDNCLKIYEPIDVIDK